MMNKTYNAYKDAVIRFLNDYEETANNHIIEIMISVIMTRDGLLQGGSFVQAVISNNLKDAISNADADCSKNLRIITLCANFCYPEYEMNE